MNNRILLIALSVLFTISGYSQEIRSVDGSGNNFARPNWGAAESEFIRFSSPDYSDGISAPNGIGRPNPRELSNYLFSQPDLIPDAKNHSDFLWLWGQLIDHDFSLIDNNPSEPAIISVPTGDPDFDPEGLGMAFIPMFRSLAKQGTGTGPNNPREHINQISAFIDGSAVYGSDLGRANWLRTFVHGKLKSSERNFLPFNTVDGKYNSPVDPLAPFMADDLGTNDKLFVAGDVRANENLLLTSIHTLLLREHNRLCDEARASNPSWGDEELYQWARRRVGAYMQAVTYFEWLPTMGIFIEEYTGYDPFINPSIANEFSASAYRLGHTLLSSEIMLADEHGEELDRGNIRLKDAFFQPLTLLDLNEIEPLLRGAAINVQQEMDGKMVDDVRNFLFGEPGFGGLDLAAININRGRERGVSDYNSFRIGIGLSSITSFEQINSNPEIYMALEHMYGNVNNIDNWVGLLAEEHETNCLFGETLTRVLQIQFKNLRDGDRFFFLNDDAFSEDEKEEIKNTRLSDIILRNSDISRLQRNVFKAKEYKDIPFADTLVSSGELNVAAFPIPLEDVLFVQLNSLEDGPGALELYSVDGKLVRRMEVDISEGINNLEFSSLEDILPGTYQLKVSRGHSNSTIQVLKY